jgi:hypothetical protein
LKQALQSKDRPWFDAVFDALVAQQYLVRVEGNETHYEQREKDTTP